MKVLLINARQPVAGMSEGKLNAYIADTISEHLAAKGREVRTTNIVDGYDVEEEVQKHL